MSAQGHRKRRAERVAHVGAVALRNLRDLFLPSFLRVIDKMICAIALADVELRFVRGGRDDFRAESFCDLNRRKTDCIFRAASVSSHGVYINGRDRDTPPPAAA